MEREHSCTLAGVIPAIVTIRSAMQGYIDGGSDSLKILARNVLEALNEKFTKMESQPLYSVALVLQPVMGLSGKRKDKKLSYLVDYELSKTWDYIREKALELAPREVCSVFLFCTISTFVRVFRLERKDAQ